MPEPMKPPPGVSGKWIVIIMVPIVLISFAWLAYNRMNFVHPTDLSKHPGATRPTEPAK